MKIKLSKRGIVAIVMIILISIIGYFSFKKYKEDKWSKCFEWMLENYEKITPPPPDHTCYQEYQDIKPLFEKK